MSLSGPRVFDGRSWTEAGRSSAAAAGGQQPLPPVLDGDGTIFVSIVSFRDGERCGATLQALFENAIHPEKIVVGLFEQNAPDDMFCLEQYCSNFGAMHTHKRQTIRQGVTKIMPNQDQRLLCPHFDQVRLVAYHDIQAKGPTYARSLVRKVLGNEEFCMQIDAHSDFAKGWDEFAVSEWKQTNNEFGILSAVPAAKAEKENYVKGADKYTEVPRQCSLRFKDNGIPDYMSPADGKVADLDRPLLGHGWSAAFSFAKCHLEESAPYDSFSIYAMPIEQFSRFARFWTRGYDVYTPSRNIVFHDYEEQGNGHGGNEWFKRQRDRFRMASIARVKTLLQLPGSGGETEANAPDNLGIYGLGRRRSLEQLEGFARLNLQTGEGNVGLDHCANHEWVPYDTKVSPTENLYINPSNLDPQPEYPLRTKMIYYEQQQYLSEFQSLTIPDERNLGGSASSHELLDRFDVSHTSALPPVSLLFVFWIVGLCAWVMVFLVPQLSGSASSKSRGGSHKKSTNMYKNV